MAEGVPAALCNVEAPQDQQEKEDQEQAGAHQAPLLGQDGKNKVGVLLGQEIERVLGALQVALARQHAGPDGDLGLDDVVARAQRVPFRIQKGEDPALLVGLEEKPDQGDGHHAPGYDGDQGPPFNLHEYGYRKGDEHHDHAGAQIRLPHDDGNRDESQNHGPHQFPQGQAPGIDRLGKITGQDDDHPDLDQFGRLQRGRPDLQPPPRAADVFAEPLDP